MSDLPQVPKLAGGSPISISKKELFSLDCPKCRKPLDVTNLAFGTNIECPHCKNITWRPEFKPKWWFKARNMIIANIVSLFLGVISSLLASYIYEKTGSKEIELLTDRKMEIINER